MKYFKYPGLGMSIVIWFIGAIIVDLIFLR
jgi:hypothetical protein